MATRWQVTKAVRASDLPAPSRLVMLTLADVAEVGTAEIPARFTPSLRVLSTETALDRRTVQRHLAALEEAGWIVRSRPDAKAQWFGERVRYRLDLPSGMEPPQVAEDHQGGGTEPPGGWQETTRGAAESPVGGGTEPPLETDLSDRSQIRSDHPAPQAPEVLDAEIVDEPTNLPAVVATLDEPNAGLVTRQWIDHCAAAGVKLPTATIKRYGKHISDAMKQGFDVNLIKRALAAMLDDNEAARPSLFDNYLVRAQTGPAKAPKRMSHTEASMTSGGGNVAAFIRDALTRPA